MPDYTLEPLVTDEGRGFVVCRTYDGQRLQWRTLPLRDGLQAFAVVGVQHRGKALQQRSFVPGNTVVLVREPDNEYDPNAIAVWNEDRTEHVGYIPRDDAHRFAQKLDKGERWYCISMWERLEGRKRVGLRILAIRDGASVGEPGD